MITTLLSPEQCIAFGSYAIRYCEHLAPGQILHDEDAHVIWVRGSTDAEKLVADLNAAAAEIRSREDAFLLWRMGISGELETTSG